MDVCTTRPVHQEPGPRYPKDIYSPEQLLTGIDGWEISTFGVTCIYKNSGGSIADSDYSGGNLKCPGMDQPLECQWRQDVKDTALDQHCGGNGSKSLGAPLVQVINCAWP